MQAATPGFNQLFFDFDSCNTSVEKMVLPGQRLHGNMKKRGERIALQTTGKKRYAHFFVGMYRSNLHRV
jgi:hypothetical protein